MDTHETKGSGAVSTPEASALPVVAYVRFMTAQHNAGQGNIEHEEWWETCKPDQFGVDGSKAEAVTWHDSAIAELAKRDEEIAVLKQQLADEQAHVKQLETGFTKLEQQLVERNADAERYRALFADWPEGADAWIEGVDLVFIDWMRDGHDVPKEAIDTALDAWVARHAARGKEKG